MCADKCSTLEADVVIVGSGIAGALIAKQLGLAKKRVVILEAGAELLPDINEYMKRFYNASAKVPEAPYTPELFTEGRLTDPARVNAGRPTVLSLGPKTADPKRGFGDWTDPRQSYLIQKGRLPFASTYERINGGTVRHWLGTSLRNVPSDFKMQSTYGRFVDWPIDYNQLNEWYGKAEHEIGVSADKEEQEKFGVQLPPGYFPKDYSYPMPGIPLSLVDKAVARVQDINVDGETLPVKVTATPAARNSQPYQNRRVCAGNTNCIPICPIGAKYDPSFTLADAFRTGNVCISYRTVAHEIIIGDDGRVTEIRFKKYDKDTVRSDEEGTVKAKIFVIAANAIETPRLLLMSTNEGRMPQGVANTTGLVGKNLMDHPIYLAWALAAQPVYGYRGPLSTAGIENMRDGKFRAQRGAFRIEIGNEGWNFSKGDPYTTMFDFINGTNYSGLNGDEKTQSEALSGRALAMKLNDVLSRQFRLGFLIEQEPNERNRVTLSNQHTDLLGLPRPEIRYDLYDYEKRAFVAAKKTADRIFEKMGADQRTTPPRSDEPAAFDVEMDGKLTRMMFFGAGHIVGTYRMGFNDEDSVVNADQRAWHHPNLYLVGSGTFPTVATANPTLTIAALSLRTADAIVKALR